RRETRSALDVPRSFVASAVARLPWETEASFLLRAQSGQPFTYVASGDANGDGVSGNDLAYVPRDSADILLKNPEQWRILDRYIDEHACLREQRGRIMSRNSCRNPALFSLDGRVAKTFSLGGQGIQISVDFFNVPNLLDHRWGMVRVASPNSGVGLLTFS